MDCFIVDAGMPARRASLNVMPVGAAIAWKRIHVGRRKRRIRMSSPVVVGGEGAAVWEAQNGCDHI